MARTSGYPSLEAKLADFLAIAHSDCNLLALSDIDRARYFEEAERIIAMCEHAI
jgi:hypothetical protein